MPNNLLITYWLLSLGSSLSEFAKDGSKLLSTSILNKKTNNMSTNKLYFTILVAALSMAFMPSMVRAQGFHPCKTNENYDKLEKSNPDLYKQLMDERIKHKADIKDRFDGVRIRKAEVSTGGASAALCWCHGGCVCFGQHPGKERTWKKKIEVLE